MSGSKKYGMLTNGSLHSRKKEGAPTLWTACMELESIMLSEANYKFLGSHVFTAQKAKTTVQFI